MTNVLNLSTTDLYLIVQAIDLARAEVHNQVATCPDVVLYAEELEELDHVDDRLVDLKTRIEKAVGEHHAKI